MANIIKTCKVCGKKYEGCSNAEKYDGVFRYQTVACSPECGAIYLARIMESRGLSVDPAPSTAESAPENKPVRRKSFKKPEPIEPVEDLD